MKSIKEKMLDKAVEMLKDIYEEDDYFCERLLDIPSEEKICAEQCGYNGPQCSCVLRYLKHCVKNEK